MTIYETTRDRVLNTFRVLGNYQSSTAVAVHMGVGSASIGCVIAQLRELKLLEAQNITARPLKHRITQAGLERLGKINPAPASTAAGDAQPAVASNTGSSGSAESLTEAAAVHETPPEALTPPSEASVRADELTKLRVKFVALQRLIKDDKRILDAIRELLTPYMDEESHIDSSHMDEAEMVKCLLRSTSSCPTAITAADAMRVLQSYTARAGCFLIFSNDLAFVAQHLPGRESTPVTPETVEQALEAMTTIKQLRQATCTTTHEASA